MVARRQPRKSSLVARRAVDRQLRVIGGLLRGRTIPYDGEPGLRPMKDRVREAVFNLIGPRVAEKRVVDLFAGTGALSFEALSRGAACATVFERKFPTARRIEETAATLGLKDRVEVSAGDTFVWANRLHPTNNTPWLVFCSPPYEFFVSRRTELHRLIEHLWNVALPNSLFVVESDGRFDVAEWFPAAHWTVRSYPPAIIGMAVN